MSIYADERTVRIAINIMVGIVLAVLGGIWVLAWYACSWHPIGILFGFLAVCVSAAPLGVLGYIITVAITGPWPPVDD